VVVVVGGAVVVVGGSVVVEGAGGAIGIVVGGTVGVGPEGGIVPAAGVLPVPAFALVGDVPLVVVVVGIDVVPGAGCSGAFGGLETTTTDHVPHVSVIFPFTWPGAVSNENQYSALPA